MKLLLANPRGFCAGVDRAVSIVERLLEIHGEPVFVRHEIVHNRTVVDRLRESGAVFVESIGDIPRGARAVLSAHGCPPEVYVEAQSRGLRLFDATCPLVTKVHLEMAEHARRGRAVAVIGHRDHVEVQGILGQYTNPDGDGAFVVENEADALALQVPRPSHIGYVTQTTLSVDQAQSIIECLRRRFPDIVVPHRQDICYATQNRQDAVRELAARSALILVIGAPHSSNSVRLCEVAEAAGAKAYLIQSAEEIEPGWFKNFSVIGLTSSASAPEYLVHAAVARLRMFEPDLTVENIGEPETVVFRLPGELRGVSAAAESRIAADEIKPASPIQRSLKEIVTMNTEMPGNATGMADVMNSVRMLAREARGLVEQAGCVAERELAMALTVTEEIRDRVISKEALERARKQPLLHGLRHDVNRAVNITFDVIATAYVFGIEIVEGFLDRPRPPIAAVSAKITA